ncbi:MAG TPA: PDZ domain-containing protein [Verrucomicrobiales bacterium]|nr:PDZ domain-containing protein [Verrucomicrobiales bacterium]
MKQRSVNYRTWFGAAAGLWSLGLGVMPSGAQEEAVESVESVEEERAGVIESGVLGGFAGAVLGGDSGSLPDEGAVDASTSLLRVNVTAQRYNFYQPWEKGNPGSRRGLGALLENGRILVTAQLVSDATFIQLELPATGEQVSAKVEGLDYEANLALLGVAEDRPAFLEGLIPLRLAEGIRTGDSVDVWQIEDNGTPVTTKAEVVDIDVGPYFLPDVFFLTYELRGSLQYRANSFTLPVVREGKLAGILLTYSAEQQASRVIPAPIIARFLEDLADGDYAGFPTFGIRYEPSTEEQLRSYLGLARGQGGVYVSDVSPESTAFRAGLQVGDVILKMDGHEVDARGNYRDEEFGLMNFSHLVRGGACAGQDMDIEIVRNGEVMELKATLERKRPEDYLIDPYLFDRAPRYLVMGGMVFQELTRPYLEIFGNQWQERAPLKLLKAMQDPASYEAQGREKLVFLSRVIRTPATVGYESLGHIVVKKVNGREIPSLAALDAAFQQPENGLHRIEFEEAPKVIYLDAQAAEYWNGQIQQAFRIQDLRQLQ